MADSPDLPQPPESQRVHCGSWNIHGLSQGKQADLIAAACQQRLDILALCETHLDNPEQLVRWQTIVDSSDRFVWFGRPAVRQSERGRASGGVGILIRSDWADHITVLPPCDHPCLLFVRLDLPDCPFPITVGVVYMVPVGSQRYRDNDALLSEMEERVAQYQSIGLTLIMGDFNTHIGCHPSVVLSPILDLSMRGSGPIDGEDEPDLHLTRSSDDPDASSKGIALLARLDASGIIVLNGLDAVGSGGRAEATIGVRRVIDLVLVDSDHWRHMSSVTVQHAARAKVVSDHRLITTHISYQPADPGQLNPRRISEPSDDTSFLISASRYRVNSRGDPHYWDQFRAECVDALSTVLECWRMRDEVVDSSLIDPERNWSELVCAIRHAADATIGVQADAPDRLRTGDGRPFYDRLVREFQRQRASILREQRTSMPGSARWTALEAELRRIGHCMQRRRRSQVQDQQTRAVERMQQLRQTQTAEHWAQLERIGGMRRASVPIPLTALNHRSEEVTETDEVRAVWSQAWGRLAQYLPQDPRFDQSFHDAVQAGVREERSDLPLEAALSAQAKAASLNCDITEEEVTASIRGLQSGKSVGCDGITAEVLKQGGPMMVLCLHRFITLVFNRGVVPADWLRGIVVPLHKDGEKRDPLNYRPITLLSIAGKVYTGVLQRRLIEWSEAHNIVVQEQGGFRPQRGCPDQLFALTELIKTRRLCRKRTYACFIDIKKAYDTVWHDGLKAKLLQYGIKGRMYAAICSLYEGCETTIRLGSALGYADFFSIETGVRQGCILSPVLYSLFINDLAVRLKQRVNCGIQLGDGGELCVLLYADDIVLLSDSEAHLAELMAEVHSYSREWRFEINHAKCGLMMFSPHNEPSPTTALSIGDRVVPWVAQYKYLGVELHAGLPFKQFRSRAEASATRAANAVSAMGMWSGKLPATLGDQVYKAMVRPLLEYCSEVWSVTPWPAAETIQLSMGKRILKCSSHTPSEAVRGDLGWLSMEARYQTARVCFWGKLQIMPVESPARRIFEDSMTQHAATIAADRPVQAVEAAAGLPVTYVQSNMRQDRGLVPWCAQLKTDLYQLGMRDDWDNPAPMIALGLKAWRTRVKSAVRTREQCRWWTAVQASSMLRTYVQLKSGPDSLQRELYLTVRHRGWNDRVLAGRRLLTRLRSGQNELRVNTGRWDRVPRDLRLCELCGVEVEDEAHFLLRCSFNTEQRTYMAAGIDAILHETQRAGQMQQPLRCSDLDPAALLTLMTGGLHPSIDAPAVQHRVLAYLMANLPAWIAVRKARLEALAELLESLDLPI